MQIEIVTPVPVLNEDLRAHIERRLRFVLARVSQRISRVIVRLGDVNGPRGGIDKQCSIQVQIISLPPVQIEGRHHNWIELVDQTAHRCGVIVVKRIERIINRRRLTRALTKIEWQSAQPAS